MARTIWTIWPGTTAWLLAAVAWQLFSQGWSSVEAAKFDSFPCLRQGASEDSGQRPGSEFLQATGVGQFGGALQSALNSARKAEQRVLKLHQSKVTAEEQWQNYCTKMKQSFVREKARFLRHVEKLQADLKDAENNMAAARAGVTQAHADGGRSSAANMEGVTIDPNTDNLFAAWDAEAAPDWDGVLNRAMSGAPPGLATPPRPAPAAPRTPGPGPMTAPAPTEQQMAQIQAFYAMMGGPHLAFQDPYMAMSPLPVAPTGPALAPADGGHAGNASPAAAASIPTHANLKAVSPHTGQRDLAKPRVPTSEEPPRFGIKDASKKQQVETMQSGLADKLEEKRAAARATMPFGGFAAGPETAEAMAALGRRPINIVQDDEEEIGPPDPGLQAEDDSLS